MFGPTLFLVVACSVIVLLVASKESGHRVESRLASARLVARVLRPDTGGILASESTRRNFRSLVSQMSEFSGAQVWTAGPGTGPIRQVATDSVVSDPADVRDSLSGPDRDVAAPEWTAVPSRSNSKISPRSWVVLVSGPDSSRPRLLFRLSALGALFLLGLVYAVRRPRCDAGGAIDERTATGLVVAMILLGATWQVAMAVRDLDHCLTETRIRTRASGRIEVALNAIREDIRDFRRFREGGSDPFRDDRASALYILEPAKSGVSGAWRWNAFGKREPSPGGVAAAPVQSGQDPDSLAGWDLSSCEACREARFQASATGEASITRPLGRPGSDGRAVLLYVPARNSDSGGTVVRWLGTDRFFRGALDGHSDPGLDMQIQDMNCPPGQGVLFDEGRDPASKDWSWREIHSVAGRTWSFEVSGHLDRRGGLLRAWCWILAMGSAASIGIGAAVCAFGRRLEAAAVRRRALEASIGLSERRMGLLARSLEAGSWRWEPGSGTGSCDEVWASWLGRQPGDFPPARRGSLEAWMHPASIPAWRAALDETVRGERDGFEMDVKWYDAAGDVVPVRESVRRFEIDGIAVVESWSRKLTEIEAFRRREEDLVEELSRERGRRAQEMAAVSRHAIVTLTDPSGRILEVNDKFCELSGYAADELVGRDHRILNSGHHGREFFASMWKTIRAGQIWHGEVCNRSKEGRLYWVDSTIVPLLDPQGRVERYLSIRTEITQLKHLVDESLEESRRRFDEIFRHMSQGVTVVSLEGRIVRANPAAAAYMAVPLDRLCGASLADSKWTRVDLQGNEIPFEDHPAIQAIRWGVPVEGVVMGLTIKGSTRWMESSAYPSHGADGRVEQAVAMFTDITDRIEGERKIRKLRDELAETSARNEAIARQSQAVLRERDDLLARLAQSPLPRSEGGRRAVKILLVEDNHVNQVVAMGILRRLGLVADLAGDGEKALAALSAVDYDLVLMDCQMPVMDGYEATRRIRDPRSDVRNHAIPVIAVTANALRGDREKCLAAGMDDHVPKPLTSDALAEALSRWLPEFVTPSSHGGDLDSQQEESACDPAIFDRAGLANRLLGQEEIIDSLVEMFLEDVPHQLDALESALAEDALDKVSLLAHTLKGTTANLEAKSVSAAAAGLEHAARAHDPTTARNLFQNLKEELAHLEAAMKAERRT